MSVWDDAVAARNPYGWWKLNEASGNFNDLGSGNHDAVVVGTLTRGRPSLVPGDPPGGAIQVSNVGGNTVRATGLSYSARNCTHMATIKSTTPGDQGWPTGLRLFFSLTTNRLDVSGTVECRINSTSATSLNTYDETPLYDGNPHLVIYVVKPTSVELWVDGTMVASNTHTRSDATVTECDVVSSNWPGEISEWGIWNSSLGSTDIASLWTAWSSAPIILGRAIETDTARPITTPINVPLGRATETDTATVAIPAALIQGGSSVVEVETGYGWTKTSPGLVLTILDQTLYRGPTALQVVVESAQPAATIEFFIDGDYVFEATADNVGNLGVTSIPVPELPKGSHTLKVRSDGRESDSATFTLLRDPQPADVVRGFDVEPVEVPGAVTASGVRRWVLQDTLPGGLGSWIMPINPDKMTPFLLDRVFEAEHTTAPRGQFHIHEPFPHPIQFSFEGYSPNRAYYDRLLAFGALRRRFFLLDHRGRAWKVAFTDVDLRPRRRQVEDGVNNDWAHDYTVKGVLYRQIGLVPQ